MLNCQRALHFCILAFMHCCILMASASPVFAGERYALIVTGASGGPEYARQYRDWRTSFAAVLKAKFNYPADHVILLADDEEPGVRKATRENVRGALADVRRRTLKDDLTLVLLVGHGTADGDQAKFNLVGPDLSVDEWAALVKPIAGRVVFVNAASGSFPFLQRLSGSGRIVLTSTDTAAQQFDTVFPGLFFRAFDDPAADVDKNGRVSVWEAFSYASAGVRQWFAERARLATERALLDDTGDGIGREAQSPGRDGAIAQVTYLQPDAPIAATASPELVPLLTRRGELESELELLQIGRAHV